MVHILQGHILIQTQVLLGILCKQGAACRVATFKLSMRVMKKMDFQKVASKVFKRTKEVKTGLDARAFPIPDKR